MIELSGKQQKILCVLKEKDQCHALTEFVCDKRRCPFFKSMAEYKIDANGCVVKR